ncbi:WbqC family protein [Rhodohalobacter barkolensis]|uniref:WbqC family protein n=1 Tax=Rhodohalobacter barkolensis TaxID=2053187 RepID=A0A2N0VI33_9BACT|nr:WbqC family protein [Rhodohalobacter barkolensis]PKD43851.1 hypothetical protein CWD77_09865 [Rhodohalobacter barkolensis]
MKLAILQPTLIPDLHDLATMLAVDTIVYQDSEQWSRKGRTHRALIRTPEGTDYISVPVLTTDKKKPINEARIDHSRDWINPLLRALKFNYSNSVYYDFYEPEVRADIETGHNFEYLLDYSLFLRKRLFQFLELEIPAKIKFSSGMKEYSSDPDKLAKRMNAEIYYQEHDARHYQRQGKQRSDLNFSHPEYRQHFDGFEPWCCLYDLLFQYGPESFRIFDELV